MDFFTKILEQFGAVFRLQEQLSTLSNSNPVVAGVVICAITLFAANIIVTQIVEIKNRFFGQQIQGRLAWIGLAAGVGIAALISAGVVLNLRQATAATPVLEVKSTIIGSPLVLNWKYDGREKSASRFEIQSSREQNFKGEITKDFRDGFAFQKPHVNDRRYWKVRAVDAADQPISAWSRVVQVSQYDNSISRIRNTRRVIVYTSFSLNEAYFKFESDDERSTLKGYDVAVLDEVIRRLPAQLDIEGPLGRELKRVSWKEVLASPDSGDADMIISTISSFAEREKKHRIQFSEPYFCTTQSLVYRPPSSAEPVVRRIEKTDVGVQEETTSERLLEEFQREIPAERAFEKHTFQEAAQVIDAVANSHISYGFTDTPFARAGLGLHDEGVLGAKELIEPGDFPAQTIPERRFERYAIAVRSGEKKLIDAVNFIIREMQQETLGQLLEKAIVEYYALRGIRNPEADFKKHPSACPQQG